jgi:hypothetical protein
MVNPQLTKRWSLNSVVCLQKRYNPQLGHPFAPLSKAYFDMQIHEWCLTFGGTHTFQMILFNKPKDLKLVGRGHIILHVASKL